MYSKKVRTVLAVMYLLRTGMATGSKDTAGQVQVHGLTTPLPALETSGQHSSPMISTKAPHLTYLHGMT